MIPAPGPGRDPQLPEDVRELDALLGAIQFHCRASHGPELIGRLRHPPEPNREHRGLLQALAMVAMVVLLGLLVYYLWSTILGFIHPRVVDQCCFDLDGGGTPDDGVLVVAGPRESIRRLTVYEDRDHSRSFTAGDQPRFTRGATSVLQPPEGGTLSAFYQCCGDYDGGGKPDDGVLVLGYPPDQVVMAGIYDLWDEAARPGAGVVARPALR